MASEIVDLGWLFCVKICLLWFGIRNHLAAGLCPEPLVSLQRSPRPSSWIKGVPPGRGGREWRGMGKMGEWGKRE